jgi:hypothetical protein
MFASPVREEPGYSSQCKYERTGSKQERGVQEMSYHASAARAADPDRPFGLRVMCLYECLERFSPFGFRATCQRLRATTGASDQGWTEVELAESLKLLNEAKQAWSQFALSALVAARVSKRRNRYAPRPSTDDLFTAWLTSYLQVNSQVCLVEGLGNCPNCDHSWQLHLYRGCRACSADRQVEWADRCKSGIPAPVREQRP